MNNGTNNFENGEEYVKKSDIVKAFLIDEKPDKSYSECGEYEKSYFSTRFIYDIIMRLPFIVFRKEEAEEAKGPYEIGF